MPLLPALSTNTGVRPAHPVVVQTIRGFRTIIPGSTLVSPFTTPTHRATTSTAFAILAGVEPFVEEFSVPVSIHEDRVRSIDSLEAVE